MTTAPDVVAGTDEPGSPAGYDAAVHDAAFIRRRDRALVRVHGRDPVRMVQGLITNELTSASAERAVYGAFLTPKGRMIADVRVLRTGDELLLDVAAAAREALFAHLKKFVPPLFARFEPADELFVPVGVYGPKALARIAALVEGAPSRLAEDEAAVGRYAGAEVRLVGTSYAGAGGVDVIVAADTATAFEQALHAAGVAALDDAALERLRIEAGSPRWGAELDEKTIPLEAGLKKRAISTSKGCYTGQEVIVRILHRGHVNRHLRGLRFDGQAPPPDTGLYVEAGGKAMGSVTSSVAASRYGGAIGLGYVRREVEPPATLVTADGLTLEVVELPFTHD